MDGSPHLSSNTVSDFFENNRYLSIKPPPISVGGITTTLKSLSLFALLIISMPSHASDNLFMTKSSLGTDDSKLLSSVKKSFLSRKWTIVEESDSALTGAIDHRGVIAEVTIYLADNELRYTCDGTREVTKSRIGGGGTGRKTFKSIKAFCPEKWVNNLKKDTRSFYYK